MLGFYNNRGHSILTIVQIEVVLDASRAPPPPPERGISDRIT